MQAINRWRNWKPTPEKFGDTPRMKVSKVSKPTFATFDTATPGQTQNFSVAIPAHDPAAWAEDFHRWALDRCCFRDRDFGGIGALHADFCEHQMARKDVPCQRSVFEALLRSAGFLFAEGLVSGLVLKTEYEAQFGKPAPAPGRLGEDGSLVIDPGKPDAALPGKLKPDKRRYRPLLTSPAKERISA